MSTFEVSGFAETNQSLLQKGFCVQCMKKIILALKIINGWSDNLPKFWVSYVCIIGDAVSLVANSITLPILHKNNLHDIPCLSCKKSFHLKVRPESSGYALNPIFKLEEATSCTTRSKQQF